MKNSGSTLLLLGLLATLTSACGDDPKAKKPVGDTPTLADKFADILADEHVLAATYVTSGGESSLSVTDTDSDYFGTYIQVPAAALPASESVAFIVIRDDGACSGGDADRAVGPCVLFAMFNADGTAIVPATDVTVGVPIDAEVDLDDLYVYGVRLPGASFEALGHRELDTDARIVSGSTGLLGDMQAYGDAIPTASLTSAIYNHMATTTTLKWQLTQAENLARLRIYRSLEADDQTGNLVAELSAPISTSYTLSHNSKPNAYHYYRIEYVTTWGEAVSPETSRRVKRLHLLEHIFGDGITNAAEMGGVAVDSDGNYWISYNKSNYGATLNRDHVVVFDASLNFVTAVTFPEEDVNIYIMDEGPDGNMYISGLAGSTIYVVNLSGDLVTTITDSKLEGPAGLAFDSDGGFWAVSLGLGKVHHFDSEGNWDATLATTSYSTTLDGPAFYIERATSNSLFLAGWDFGSIIELSLDGDLLRVADNGDVGTGFNGGIDKASTGLLYHAEYYSTGTLGHSQDGGYIRIYNPELALIDRFKMPDTPIGGTQTDAVNVRVLPNGKLLVGDWRWGTAYLLGD